MLPLLGMTLATACDPGTGAIAATTSAVDMTMPNNTSTGTLRFEGAETDDDLNAGMGRSRCKPLNLER